MNKSTMKNVGIVGVIFAMVGFLMLLGSGLWAKSVASFVDEAASTQGEVIEMVMRRSSDSTTYAPKYRFVVDGQQVYTVTSSSGSNPPGYEVGEKLQVLYNPQNPSDAKINSFMGLWFGPVLVGAMGLVFSLFAAVPAYMFWRRRNNVALLMRQGMPVMAEFQRVEQGTEQKGHSDFYIVARWHDQAHNQVHVYRSEPMGFDPSEFISPKQLITVLVHKQKPTVYYVDTSFLPEQRV